MYSAYGKMYYEKIKINISHIIPTPVFSALSFILRYAQTNNGELNCLIKFFVINKPVFFQVRQTDFF